MVMGQTADLTEIAKEIMAIPSLALKLNRMLILLALLPPSQSWRPAGQKILHARSIWKLPQQTHATPNGRAFTDQIIVAVILPALPRLFSTAKDSV